MSEADEASVAALADEAERLVGVDVRRALRATEDAVAVADASGTGRSRARRARAHALSYAGRFEESLAVTRIAIDLAEAAGDTVEAARVRLGSMQALAELGRFDEAVANGEAARRAFLNAGELALAGRADSNLGIVHQRRDDPARAVRIFERARPLLDGEPQMLGCVENGRGEALLTLNEFDGAEAAYRAALAAFQVADARLLAAIAEGNLAELSTRRGRLQTALYHFERARRHLEDDASRGNLARVRSEQAEAMAVLGMPAEALAEYEEALPELDACGLAMQAARARAGMGHVLLRAGRHAEAETALAAAAFAFDELGQAAARARVDLVRAELANAQGRRGESRRLVHSALSVLHDRPVDAAAGRLLLARLAMQEGELEAASADVAAALQIAQRLDLAPLLADVLHIQGTLQRRCGRLRESIDCLRRSVEQVDRIRDTFQAERFRAAFLGDRLKTYERLLVSLLDLDGVSATVEAFSVAERARSRSLLEMIGGGAALDEENQPDDADDRGHGRLKSEMTRLRSELSAFYSRLGDEVDDLEPAPPRLRTGDHDHGRADWQREVERRERRLQDLESRLATTRGVASLYAPACGVEQVQDMLDERTALVEFVEAEGELMAFVVRRGGITTHRRLASSADVAERVRRVRFQINRALRPGALAPRRADRLIADARRELGVLHDLLLAPIRRELDACTRLAIVPHGPLHLVPFNALWDGERSLIERLEVHVAPSASVLVQLRGRDGARRGPGQVLIAGVGDDHAPRIESEASALASMMVGRDVRLLLGAAATREAVRQAAGRASVIHLACHGRFTASTPLASGLRLADGWLTLRDLYAMRLQADLVTLSGCETGLSLVQVGDELLGLLRGFLAAGARSVLVSLWRVDDEVASTMMPSFYKCRANAAPNVLANHASALRRVQLELMAEHPHPAYWAPFILVGQP